MVAVSVIWVRFRVGLSWLDLGFVFGTGVRLRTELVLRLGLGFWLGLGTGGRMMSAVVIFFFGGGTGAWGNARVWGQMCCILADHTAAQFRSG